LRYTVFSTNSKAHACGIYAEVGKIELYFTVHCLKELFEIIVDHGTVTFVQKHFKVSLVWFFEFQLYSLGSMHISFLGCRI